GRRRPQCRQNTALHAGRAGRDADGGLRALAERAGGLLRGTARPLRPRTGGDHHRQGTARRLRFRVRATDGADEPQTQQRRRNGVPDDWGGTLLPQFQYRQRDRPPRRVGGRVGAKQCWTTLTTTTRKSASWKIVPARMPIIITSTPRRPPSSRRSRRASSRPRTAAWTFSSCSANSKTWWRIRRSGWA